MQLERRQHRQHIAFPGLGRLDTRRTIRLLGEGQLRVASVTHDRSLDHPVTRVLVRAERVLAERLTGTAEWRTERVRQVLPQLRAAAGSRPKLPTAFELARVRYTPITLPFKQAAVLSHRIASKLGYSATDEPGAAEGILVDVAELWELFVLHCARRAIPVSFRIEHGTTAGRRDYLLRSEGTVCLPKILSAQVGVAIWFRRGPDELVARQRSARCSMMDGCAAATGLPGCDERVRVTAASSRERPG